ncbi:hypothetical protein NMY22_g14306 [Coprinellus aureogranulatus]|nr:hypothetical protein NMY22_g14306 [Coprinellus aureogranulatus]
MGRLFEVQAQTLPCGRLRRVRITASNQFGEPFPTAASRQSSVNRSRVKVADWDRSSRSPFTGTAAITGSKVRFPNSFPSFLGTATIPAGKMAPPPPGAPDSHSNSGKPTSEARDRRQLDEEEIAVERNLNNVVEQTEELESPTLDDEPIISIDDILFYLVETPLYSTKTERWIQFPANAESKDSIVQALCNSIGDIIALLESRVQYDGTATRTVIDSREKKLINVGAHTQYSSPTLVITATGHSFESASNRGGYTDVATCFIVDIETAMHCLEDQIILLGVQILIQQTNREFVRCFYMTENGMRLIHFDRAGAQFGPLVNIHQEPEIFVQYILGVCSFDEEQLGFDTSVFWKHDEDGKKISGYISVTDENNIRTRYPMRMVDPWVAHPEIESRGLKVWKATELLNGNLRRAKGVAGVVQMISMEAKCFPFTGTMRAHPSRTPYDNPTQYHKSKSRVVLEQYGSKLVSCEDERQFLTALRDAIAGMKGLNDAGLLHRDVSWGNVLLGNDNASPGDRGVLIDLDMAYDANEFSEERNMGCGTPGYMSINVLTRNTDKDFKRRYIRDHLDDLESVFYVLCEAARRSSCESEASLVRGKNAQRQRRRPNLRT